MSFYTATQLVCIAWKLRVCPEETNHFFMNFPSGRFPASSSHENDEEYLPSSARYYRIDDSDDDACEDESMVSLMCFLEDTIRRIRVKLQFSSSLPKEVPVLCMLTFLRPGSSFT